jgi:hypothetical protein
MKEDGGGREKDLNQIQIKTSGFANVMDGIKKNNVHRLKSKL